uniref:NADH-ubiquinone oxidoreductase chain 5 n=1 Tax=Cucujus sp. MJ-2020 TaxID=2762519 RepID=A0A7G7MTL9_9CUCU|nr:NADH dehydrogenase subunit 5 [Cucujus sp. MJ-2020]
MDMICLIYFLILLGLSIMSFIFSVYFMILDYTMILEFNLLSLNTSSVLMTILLDWMSLLFMSFVMFISSMVVFYSGEYMHGDKNIKRFILLVILFVVSMMLLIISPNLISLLLGWDGLGLVSYCLVIYYQNMKSYNAGMLTALSNRIGDVALLMAIAWIFNYGSWNYYMYINMVKLDYEMKLISILVILAALTKSAQIPFSSWLPAAMAAPTPVSSLVHSSTLVTAGVYLLIRFNFCFSENLKLILLLIASLTMFMSGLGASFEFDLKKIIALSTLSQLGLMLSILALGEYILAFYHLLTHALFKALLFMCAGNIIHNLGGCQDIRLMGGLIKFMPLTCAFFSMSNFSLCGIPFMSGFYSKDLIVEIMSMQYLNVFIYMVFYVSIGLTMCYSIRLSYYLLVGSSMFLSIGNVAETSKIMLKGMSGLIFFVVFSGSMLSWLIFPSPYFICLMFELKIMTLIMIMLGGWLGYEFSKFSLDYNLKSLSWYHSSMFFSSMWNMPVISTLGMNYYPIYLGGKYKIFDQGWIEYYGSKILVLKLIDFSSLFQLIMKNHLKIYFMMVMIWLMFLYIL